MSAIIGLFIFGIIADKPPLPTGFNFIEARGEWLCAADGRRKYFVTRKKLILRRHVRRRDVRRTSGRLKLGGHFADFRHAIPLPCTPAS
jgi:hypothetical protein